MAEKFGAKTSSVGIIGGGTGGLELLKFFGNDEVTRVTLLVDTDSSAPGIQAARERSIPVFNELLTALQGVLPDFLFDTTGDPEVETTVRQHLKVTSTRLVNAATSRMMVDVLNLNGQKMREEIAQVVGTIQHDLGESLGTSAKVVSRINSVMSSMQMLALNASIEAAKAGTNGRGFMVVANQLGQSVDAVRNLTREINQVNENMVQAAKQSATALETLKWPRHSPLPETTAIEFNVDGLPPVTRAEVLAIGQELADLIQRHCGGRIRLDCLDLDQPTASMEA